MVPTQESLVLTLLTNLNVPECLASYASATSSGSDMPLPATWFLPADKLWKGPGCKSILTHKPCLEHLQPSLPMAWYKFRYQCQHLDQAFCWESVSKQANIFAMASYQKLLCWELDPQCAALKRQSLGRGG